MKTMFGGSGFITPAIICGIKPSYTACILTDILDNSVNLTSGDPAYNFE